MKQDGSFYKGSPPTFDRDNWCARATKVGTYGWADFKFIFFGPDGHLYAVKSDGSFYKAQSSSDTSSR